MPRLGAPLMRPVGLAAILTPCRSVESDLCGERGSGADSRVCTSCRGGSRMSTEPRAGRRAPAHSRASLRPRVELARRHASGITVRLLWNRETNVRAVSVVDVHGRSFDLVLIAGRASARGLLPPVCLCGDARSDAGGQRPSLGATRAGLARRQSHLPDLRRRIGAWLRLLSDASSRSERRTRSDAGLPRELGEVRCLG